MKIVVLSVGERGAGTPVVGETFRGWFLDGGCRVQQDNGTGKARHRGRKSADPQAGRGDSGEDQRGRDRGVKTGRSDIPVLENENWDIRSPAVSLNAKGY